MVHFHLPTVGVVNRTVGGEGYLISIVSACDNLLFSAFNQKLIMAQQCDVVIVGAGLAGLTAATELKKLAPELKVGEGRWQIRISPYCHGKH